MKYLLVFMISVMFSGCYVLMPSVGIKPTRVYHQETCAHDRLTGQLRCTHTRRYVK